MQRCSESLGYFINPLILAGHLPGLLGDSSIKLTWLIFSAEIFQVLISFGEESLILKGRFSRQDWPG
jgi:EamA domain-containing membrane protein RarD